MTARVEQIVPVRVDARGSVPAPHGLARIQAEPGRAELVRPAGDTIARCGRRGRSAVAVGCVDLAVEIAVDAIGAEALRHVGELVTILVLVGGTDPLLGAVVTIGVGHASLVPKGEAVADGLVSSHVMGRVARRVDALTQHTELPDERAGDVEATVHADHAVAGEARVAGAGEASDGVGAGGVDGTSAVAGRALVDVGAGDTVAGVARVAGASEAARRVGAGGIDGASAVAGRALVDVGAVRATTGVAGGTRLESLVDVAIAVVVHAVVHLGGTGVDALGAHREVRVGAIDLLGSHRILRTRRRIIIRIAVAVATSLEGRGDLPDTELLHEVGAFVRALRPCFRSHVPGDELITVEVEVLDELQHVVVVRLTETLGRGDAFASSHQEQNGQRGHELRHVFFSEHEELAISARSSTLLDRSPQA